MSLRSYVWSDVNRDVPSEYNTCETQILQLKLIPLYHKHFQESKLQVHGQ